MCGFPKIRGLSAISPVVENQMEKKIENVFT